MQLMLGTAQFGLDYGIANNNGKVSAHDAELIMRLAVDNEVSWIDTAHTYGDCQKIIGNINPSIRNKLNIVTKTPDLSSMGDTMNAKIVRESLKQSIEDLKTKPKALLIHHTGHVLNDRRVFEELAKTKEDGLVEKIGITVYTPEETLSIIKEFPMDIIQLPCSIFNQSFITSGVLQTLYEKNIEVHIRSIFLQGLVFMPTSEMHSFFNPIKKHIDGFHKELLLHDISIEKAAIDFAKNTKAHRIIVGIQTPDQFKAVLASYMQETDHNIDFGKYAITDSKFNNPANWTIG